MKFTAIKELIVSILCLVVLVLLGFDTTLSLVASAILFYSLRYSRRITSSLLKEKKNADN